MSEQGQPGGEATIPTSRLAKSADALEAFVKPIYTWLAYIGAAILGLLVLAMTWSVIGRRFFDAPLQGSGDIIEMSMLLMTFLAIGLEHMGHEKMSVEVIVDHFPKKLQDIIAPIIYFLGVAVLCMAVWQLIKWGIRIQDRGETTPGTLKLPKYPFVYFAAFGMLTVIPNYLVRLLNSLDRLVKK
jgi:TRAP-type C4-dicarboxylate transport system permease small subunit